MADIASLGTPVNQASLGYGTVLQDNFVGSYSVGGTTPPVTAIGKAWSGNGVALSGVVLTSGDGTVASNYTLTWSDGAYAATVLTAAKINIGYVTPISNPSDPACEFRMKVDLLYDTWNGFLYATGTLRYNVEICRLLVAGGSPPQLGIFVNPTGQHLYQSLSSMTSTGTWVCITAIDYGGYTPSLDLLRFAYTFVKLPDDIALNSAYDIQLQISTDRLQLFINDIPYASLVFPVDFGSRGLTTVSLNNDRHSYPGSGGAVFLGGIDSVRASKLVDQLNPPFWNHTVGSRELLT